MKLYDCLETGNGYKVRLTLARPGMTCDWEECDILAESNAIVWYLAEGSALVPADRLQRARVLQWMFFEQYSHEPYVATPRFIVRHLPPDSPRRAELADRLERGYDLAPYPHVRAWLDRAAAEPGHLPITARPVAR